MMNTLPGILFLAPMAETTTPALRYVVKNFHQKTVLYSEMLSAGAVVAGGAHNEPLVHMHHFDAPLIYQIVGGHPEIMAEASAVLAGKGCHGIDINMGCPNHEIVKKGHGARLLTDIVKARKIIRACRKELSIPLSVKMRTGYDDNDTDRFLAFIRMLEDEGVDCIAIHPRYAKLSFRRMADWRYVRLAKETLSIPVIGNGDIDSPESALEKMAVTGCDGIMIGREAIKSPWIFHLTDRLLKGQKGAARIDIREVFINTLGYIREFLPERLHKSRSHRFAIYFSKNVRYGHELFKKIRPESSILIMQEIVDDYFRRNPEESIREFRIGTDNQSGTANPVPTFPTRTGEAIPIR